MLALLLLACVPPDMLGAPLPDTYAPEATHYRTDTLSEAQLAPLEVRVLEEIQAAARVKGQEVRVDAALTEAARVLAYRQVTDGLDADNALTRRLAMSLGAPLPVRNVGALTERRGQLTTDFWPALIDEVGPRLAVGIGAWDDKAGRQSSAFVVVAVDGLSLDAPVPMDGADKISGTWSGETGLQAYLEPVQAPLDLSEAPGPFSLTLPEGVVRLDLTTRDAMSTPVAWMDFQGAPEIGPLPGAARPQDRVLAGFNAMRAEAGVAPLVAVEGPEPCRSWPNSVGGAPVSGNQRCARVTGSVGVEDWWDIFVARPYTKFAVLDPNLTLANIQPSASWHLYEPFEILTPEQGEARALEMLQRLYPGVVIDQTAQAALREGAALGAGVSQDAVEQGLERLRQVEVPFKGKPMDLYYSVNVAERFEDLEEGFKGDKPCLKVGVGYAQGPDANGDWWHVLASFCAVTQLEP